MSYLYQAFGWVLGLIFQFVHSYGWSIVIFTILCKLILLPLNIKSTKSMKEMQALNPELQRLGKQGPGAVPIARHKAKGLCADVRGNYATET